MAQAGSYAPVARMEAKAREVQAEVTLEKQRRKSALGASSSSPQAERCPSSPGRTISQCIAANSPRAGSIAGIAEVANAQRRAVSALSPRRRSMPSRDGAASNGDDENSSTRDGSPPQGRRRRKTGGGNDAVAMGMTENLRVQLTREAERAQAELQLTQNRMIEMEQELNTRQESYIRREKRYKDEIAALKSEIESNSSSERWSKVERAGMGVNGSRRDQIVGMHTEILRTLENFNAKPSEKSRPQNEGTSSQPWLNPKPTPRAAEAQAAAETQEFKDRLREQEIHVKAERQSDKDKQFLVDKIAALRKTLEEQQVANHDLKVEASQAKEVARRLRSQFEYQDDDREALMRKLHIFKSENQRLKSAIEGGEAKVCTSPLPPSPTKSKYSRNGKEMDPMAVLSDEVPRARSLEEVIEGLKQLLMQERVRTRKARAAHTAELQQRTSLQAILRQAVEDTRRQRAAVDSVPHSGRARPQTAPSRRPVSARPNVAASTGTSDSGSRRSITTLLPDGITTDDLMDEEGRRLLVDSLMAKEEVMKLLFNRTFPGVDVEPKSKANTINRIAERAEQEEYLMTAAGQRAQRDAQSRYGASTGVQRSSTVGGGHRASVAATSAYQHGGPRPSMIGGTLPVDNHGLNVRSATRPWVLDVDTMLSDFMQPLHGGKQYQTGAGQHEQQAGRPSFVRPF